MPKSKHWGATPDQWFHFDLVLGRGSDLLPVVCNPNAQLSPDSTLKALGKTPSKYNRQRHVVGFNNWTNRQTNNAELEQWIAEPDYGICARMGGGWLALDCDREIPEIQATVCEILR
ncbi:hypothetical protein JZM24_04970 [Candidatus Sodalis endolongispinus]|uniref:DNA primase/polymerase bifunctional N-terminal domain-containing protein n=1 Tax=Candidatus Sodalis endolongispinus TaxID=2812662 RepID=A0ABS5Y9J8_9GAMM|nr:hypothetical protein [Candidatus Sodalis endolongispinus]